MRPAGYRFGFEIGETPGRDRRAHAGHQLLVIGEIDGRQQHLAEDFVGLDQMMQIGAGIGRAPPGMRAVLRRAGADRRRGARSTD